MGASLTKEIAENLRRPTRSITGWYVKQIFKKYNTVLEHEAVRLSKIQPHHKVLEVGFGVGQGLQQALKQVAGGPGQIYGVDISWYMVDHAMKRFHAHILTGKLVVVQGNVSMLPFNNKIFDRVFHCNCYYFWSDQSSCVKELFRVLKPGGMMVTTMNLSRIRRAKEKGYFEGTFCDPINYMASLENVGFVNVRLQYFEQEHATVPKFQVIFAHVPE